MIRLIPIWLILLLCLAGPVLSANAPPQSTSSPLYNQSLPPEWIASGRNGTHHISKVTEDGEFLILDDGSVWRSEDNSDSEDWSQGDEVFVRWSEIINLSQSGKKIDASCEERTCKIIAESHVIGDFEGSDNPIALDNGMIFEATSYHYHYAYRPEVLVLATKFCGITLYRLIIGDEIYNANRLR